MGKHWANPKAKCPFYRHEDNQMIYCDGPVAGSVIHVAFPDRPMALEYKQVFCQTHYKECRVYQMLERKEREEDD